MMLSQAFHNPMFPVGLYHVAIADRPRCVRLPDKVVPLRLIIIHHRSSSPTCDRSYDLYRREKLSSAGKWKGKRYLQRVDIAKIVTTCVSSQSANRSEANLKLVRFSKFGRPEEPVFVNPYHVCAVTRREGVTIIQFVAFAGSGFPVEYEVSEDVETVVRALSK